MQCLFPGCGYWTFVQNFSTSFARSLIQQPGTSWWSGRIELLYDLIEWKSRIGELFESIWDLIWLRLWITLGLTRFLLAGGVTVIIRSVNLLLGLFTVGRPVGTQGLPVGVSRRRCPYYQLFCISAGNQPVLCQLNIQSLVFGMFPVGWLELELGAMQLVCKYLTCHASMCYFNLSIISFL